MLITQKDLLDIKYALEFTRTHSKGNTTTHERLLDRIRTFEEVNPHYNGYYALIEAKINKETHKP